MKPSFKSVSLCLLLAVTGWAQAPAPAPQAPAPQAPAPAATTPPAASSPATVTLSPPKEVSSTVNTGTGLSIEPMYWYSNGSPSVRAGETWITGAGTSPGALSDNAANPGDADFNAPRRPSYGARITIPVSKNATIRVTYFQTESSGVTSAPGNMNLFGQPIAGGDILPTQYHFQNYKLSYDYLTYFWKRGGSELRLKTLWEVQRISVNGEFDDLQVDSTGALTNINPIINEQSVLLPTFGLGLEHTLSRHFRWEVRASGFGLPHRGDIGDAEADLAVRFGHFELLGGGRLLHYKTNPSKAQYTIGNLYGPYVSLRYYWKKN